MVGSKYTFLRLWRDRYWSIGECFPLSTLNITILFNLAVINCTSLISSNVKHFSCLLLFKHVCSCPFPIFHLYVYLTDMSAFSIIVLYPNSNRFLIPIHQTIWSLILLNFNLFLDSWPLPHSSTTSTYSSVPSLAGIQAFLLLWSFHVQCQQSRPGSSSSPLLWCVIMHSHL